MGADIVVHSATKYINGHSDVIVGCVCRNKKDIQNVAMIGIKDCIGLSIGSSCCFFGK